MNVLIMTDLEGISCVDSIEQMSGDGYKFACERLMLDLNAAVEGAIEGGAKNVYVVDGHAKGSNFIYEMLDKRAKAVKLDEYHPMLQNREIDAYMKIGCHAMAGTLNGFLDHTMSSATWYNLFINGRKCGEIALGAMYVGAYGVPTVMVSGDEAACMEARDFLGDIVTVPVKYGIGRNKACCRPSDEAISMIREGAKNAMGLIGKTHPLKPVLPAEIILEYCRSDYCDEAFKNNRQTAERLDARSLRKVITRIEKYSDLFF
jgi:D-amino peptidase